MIKQIIFYVYSDDRDDVIETPILSFDWDGKSPVMDVAYQRLKVFMDERFPNEEYRVSDWEWADKLKR